MPRRPKPRHGYLGVGREKKYSLDEQTRKRLQDIIGQDCPTFLKAFERLVPRYQLRYELERQAPKPTEIRVALEELHCTANKLHCTANKLYELLNKMDTSTRGVLYDYLYPSEKSTDDLMEEDRDVLDRLIANLEPLILATQQGSYCSPEVRQRGRPRKPALDWLASGLALAFTKHLVVRPTKTRGGKFDQCLRIAAEAAGSRESRDFPSDRSAVLTTVLKKSKVKK